MKKIAIYSDGSKGLIETGGGDTILINGLPPTKLIDATHENIQKHFGDVQQPKDSEVVI